MVFKRCAFAFCQSEENINVRSIHHYLPLFVLLLVCLPFAQAQSQVDFNVGFGTAHASSLGSVDINTLNPCAPGGTCGTTPALSGFFMGFGGNLMLWKHIGIGVDVATQPAKQNYLTFQQQNSTTGAYGDVLQSRVTFYDFDARDRRVTLKNMWTCAKRGLVTLRRNGFRLWPVK